MSNQGQFSTDHIKKVGVDHYGEERRAIRKAACMELKSNPRILELYGSGGHMTKFYQEHCENPKIVGVDTAPGTDYQMDNQKFVLSVLPNIAPFDLIDFDAYGSPNPLIYNTLRALHARDWKRFIIVSTDGLGLAMKRNPKINWMKYFLIINPKQQIPDMRRPWDHHLELTDHFFKMLRNTFNYEVAKLAAIQGKGKNFVFSAWLFERNHGTV